MTKAHTISMQKLWIAAACAAMMMYTALPTSGQLLVYEGFNYTAGAAIEGLNGGLGWDGAWDHVGGAASASADEILANSLSYTDSLGNILQTSGGQFLNKSNGTGNTRPGRTLAARRDSGTTWISFLTKRQGPLTVGSDQDGTYAPGANMSLFDTTRGSKTERLNIGPENSNNAWLNPDNGNLPEDRYHFRYPDIPNGVLNSNLPPEKQPPTPNLNRGGQQNRYRDVFTESGVDVVNFVVIRIDHKADTSRTDGDDVYIWMNPDLNSEPSLANVSGRYVNADVLQAAAVASIANPYGAPTFDTDGIPDGDQSFNRLLMFANAAGPAEVLLDEFRVGTSFAFVTPHTPVISGVLGDYNENDVVDAADYVVWRNAQTAGATSLPNRSNAITGTVGTDDYNFWRARFGAISGSGSSTPSSVPVPEPGTWLLAALACSLFASGSRGLRRNG